MFLSGLENYQTLRNSNRGLICQTWWRIMVPRVRIMMTIATTTTTRPTTDRAITWGGTLRMLRRNIFCDDNDWKMFEGYKVQIKSDSPTDLKVGWGTWLGWHKPVYPNYPPWCLLWGGFKGEAIFEPGRHCHYSECGTSRESPPAKLHQISIIIIKQ